MTDRELVRLCDPPEWGRTDRKWGMFVSGGWVGLEAHEAGRTCTICGKPAWIVRVDEIVPMKRARHTRRSPRCPDHVYGHVEVAVLVPRPLPEELWQANL